MCVLKKKKKMQIKIFVRKKMHTVKKTTEQEALLCKEANHLSGRADCYW